MNAFTAFRLSVIAPFVLSGLAATYSILTADSFSEDWQDLLSWHGDGGVFSEDPTTAPTWNWIARWIIGLTAVIALVNQVLLFFYWKPSRSIYLATCILLYPAFLLMGLIVLTPVEYILYELAAVSSGITLALIYYSPVAERFD